MNLVYRTIVLHRGTEYQGLHQAASSQLVHQCTELWANRRNIRDAVLYHTWYRLASLGYIKQQNLGALQSSSALTRRLSGLHRAAALQVHYLISVITLFWRSQFADDLPALRFQSSHPTESNNKFHCFMFINLYLGPNDQAPRVASLDNNKQAAA